MRIIPYILVFLVGGIAGHFTKNPSAYHVLKEIRVGELGNIVLALSAALFLPFTINKWIKSKQHLNIFFMNEMQHFLSVTEKIKIKLNHCCQEGQTNDNDKEEIKLLFLDSDLLLHSITKQLKDNFRKKIENYVNGLNEAYIEYWKSVTGGALFNAGYHIEISFYKETCQSYLTYEQKVKEGICLINKL